MAGVDPAVRPPLGHAAGGGHAAAPLPPAHRRRPPRAGGRDRAAAARRSRPPCRRRRRPPPPRRPPPQGMPVPPAPAVDPVRPATTTADPVHRQLRRGGQARAAARAPGADDGAQRRADAEPVAAPRAAPGRPAGAARDHHGGQRRDRRRRRGRRSRPRPTAIAYGTPATSTGSADPAAGRARRSAGAARAAGGGPAGAVAEAAGSGRRTGRQLRVGARGLRQARLPRARHLHGRSAARSRAGADAAECVRVLASASASARSSTGADGRAVDVRRCGLGGSRYPMRVGAVGRRQRLGYTSGRRISRRPEPLVPSSSNSFEVPADRPHLRIWPKRLPPALAVPETSLWFNLEVAATRFPDKAAYRLLRPRAHLSPSCAPRPRRWPAGCSRQASARATASPSSCRTARSSRSRSTPSCAPTRWWCR